MRYDLLAQDALRGVVRAALAQVGRHGLPGEHHFFISIDTRHPGVHISERLRRKHPEEVTIVLQHQFWNLEVEEDRFAVDLSFDNIPEKLVIPFAAVKGFFDPAVQFGLQFETKPTEEAAEEAPVAGSDAPPAGPPARERKRAKATASPQPSEEAPKVVSIETFRKK